MKIMKTMKKMPDPKRAAVFAACWVDPKYLALTARKDKLATIWRRDPTERNNRLYMSALRRIGKFEDAALARAGCTLARFAEDFS